MNRPITHTFHVSASGENVATGSISEHKGIESSPMILVFGCWQSEMDHIYKEETIQAKTKQFKGAVRCLFKRTG